MVFFRREVLSMRRHVLFLPGPFLALLPLLALLLFPAPAGSQMVDPIRIGVLAPLSRPFASGGSGFLEGGPLAAGPANAAGGVGGGGRRGVMGPVAATAEIPDLGRGEYGRVRYVFRVGYSIPQWAEMM